MKEEVRHLVLLSQRIHGKHLRLAESTSAEEVRHDS